MVTSSIITNNGKKIIINRGYKSVPDYTPVSKFKVGINTISTPLITDNDITRPVPITGTESVDSCDATTGWTASGTNSLSVNTTIFYEGTGSLNLIKSDTSSAVVSCSKTTTSLDFTNKRLWIFVYITAGTYAKLKASGAALSIRFGSDSSNYYEYTRTAAQLSVGNNAINFISSEATPTGSPVIASCDYTYISFETINASDTSTEGNFLFDDIKLASDDDYKQTFVATYPSFDYTNNEVTIRAFIASTEANGFNIDSFCLVNTDTSELVGDIDVFPNESKSVTDEFVFIKKNRLI